MSIDKSKLNANASSSNEKPTDLISEIQRVILKVNDLLKHKLSISST